MIEDRKFYEDSNCFKQFQESSKKDEEKLKRKLENLKRKLENAELENAELKEAITISHQSTAIGAIGDITDDLHRRAQTSEGSIVRCCA